MWSRLNVVVIAAASFAASSVSLAQTSVFLPPAAVAAPITPSVQQPPPASTEAAAPADFDGLDRDGGIRILAGKSATSPIYRSYRSLGRQSGLSRSRRSVQLSRLTPRDVV